MFSIAQNDDKRLLVTLGETIIALTKLKEPPFELIEKMGKQYEELATKIKTHDYSAADESLERILNITSKIKW
jgi:hypothetical protein